MPVPLADRSSLFHCSPRYPVRAGDASEHLKGLLGSIGRFPGGNRRPSFRPIPSRLCVLAVNAAYPSFTAKTRRRKESVAVTREPQGGFDWAGYLTDNGAKIVRGCAAMKSVWSLAILPFLCIGAGPPPATETLFVQGLDQPVEILK